MPKLFLFNFLIIIYLFPFLKQFLAESLLFEWIPSNQLSKTKYWINKENCEKRENKNNSFVAILDGEMKVYNLVLPENGIIFFGNKAKIEEEKNKEKKQCLEESFNSPKIDEPNFFDGANWQIKKVKSVIEKEEYDENEEEEESISSNIFLLDAQKVPSIKDDVLFPKEKSSKISLNVQTKVRSLNFSGNLLSNDQLRHLPYTIEGQLQLILGDRVSIEYKKLNKSLLFNLPLGLVLKINEEKSKKDEKMKEREIFFGSPNSNFFEPQFSALCAFVNCEPLNNYCSLPLKPVGQCCEQCGAILSFRQNTLNFTKSLEIIKKYGKLIKDFEWLPKDSGISFVRIDNDDFHPLYQISILNKHSSNYNENQFCSVIWDIFKRIQQGINSHLPVEYQPSAENEDKFYFDLKLKCSRQVGIIHFKELVPWLFLGIIFGVVLILAVRSEYRRNPRLRLFIAESLRNERFLNINVKWRRGTNENVEIPTNWNGNNEINDQTRINLFSTVTGSVSEFVNKAFLKSAKIDENEELLEEEDK
uniref:Protein amnionless n=1 Tax=Meloidogyne enterolobii TaxID=390850 RepID=A0A6V7XL40_MELEN|nr:unnamed protein product [Meloidogyne enterolobii]